MHGGLAQGVAQILYEGVRYDADANPLTASLLDYLVPAASDLPAFTTAHTRHAEPEQPAGREGHRRIGHHRLDRRGLERGDSTRSQPFGVVDIDPPCRRKWCGGRCTPAERWTTRPEAP